LEIPYSQLSTEALRGIVEEFVSREGTDYGCENYTLKTKVDQVFQQIIDGRVIIDYDPETGSCHLRPRIEGTQASG